MNIKEYLRNIKGSLLSRLKIVLGNYLDLYKVVENMSLYKVKCVGKYEMFMYIIFF